VRKPFFWPTMVLFVCLVLSLGSACYAEDKIDLDGRTSKTVPFGPKGDDDAYQQIDLKKQCLAATLSAINLEMNRYQRWIDLRKQQGDQKDLAELQESLETLKADLDKYLAMDAKDFALPAKVEAVAWVGDKPGKDSILYVEDMSKSGPWYHLAGIVGDDYAILQSNTKSRMAFYPVYPRSYGWMHSAYIYIQETTPPSTPGKRITGEVFGCKYSGPLNDLVECENYQVYLLQDNKPGTKGELILDSKKAGFDFTLSEEKLKKYSFIEFVSSDANKTIKLTEIKEGALQVILGRDMIVKKPAIYLYPAQKSQVVVIHNFKGKILNTYPTYSDNWTVIAEPNGNLLNVRDNRYYNYLFWDGIYSFSAEHYQFNSGFYVQRADYVSFLQSKLAGIGLNENEINDFIVYWLPIMSNHKNCFVHFRINDNIDESSILETKPAAETTIRVFMEFSGIENITSAPKLPEQNLLSFIRKGFTLVEWGGAEIGNSKIE